MHEKLVTALVAVAIGAALEIGYTRAIKKSEAIIRVADRLVDKCHRFNDYDSELYFTERSRKYSSYKTRLLSWRTINRTATISIASLFILSEVLK